ncbi:GTP cyclohydrolase II [Candidatus Puniceispirillum sp.]|nr:GTP cyclohydrolase II [Candidatus Puniceispirillum sp.]
MQDKRAKNAHMKTERAAAELHRGGHVMLRLNNGEAALFRGAEFADIDDIIDLSRLAGSGPLLVLTANRVKSLGRSLRKDWPAATIALANHQLEHVFEFVFGHAHLAKDDGINLVAERVGSIADHATRLLRNSKLLPAALLVRLPFRDIAVQDRFALEHNILVLEARDLESYQNHSETRTRITARAKVPLAVAEDAEVVMFRAEVGHEDHFAVLIGTGAGAEAPIVRLHSQCITGDVLGSLKCDCGEQLQTAMRMMTNEGGGVLIYLAQEGRDIGLLNKMRAYALQDKGFDTVDANHALGFATDERVFLPAARILNALGITQLRLITNNPDKISQLERYGIKVKERLPMDINSNPHNEHYIATKKHRTGHMTPSKKDR